jgi:membrane fusion protein (multidrug efflux system)
MLGTVYIRASFTNPTEMLRSGSNGYIVLPYVMHDVIVIPQEAAVDIHDKYLVYKVVDGKAVETEVTIMSYNDGEHFVVTSGLVPGDVIIAEGAGLVKDGIEVTEKKDKKDKKGGKQS